LTRAIGANPHDLQEERAVRLILYTSGSLINCGFKTQRVCGGPGREGTKGKEVVKEGKDMNERREGLKGVKGGGRESGNEREGNG
jgi:hypothetical protein